MQRTKHFQLKVDIWNAGHPDELTTAEMQAYYYRTRGEQFPYHISFIEHDGQVIGYGGYSQNPTMAKAKKHFIFIAIQPDYPEQQAARNFYLENVCEQLKNTNTEKIVGWTREDHTEDLHFFNNNEFVQVLRAPVSALDVDGHLILIPLLNAPIVCVMRELRS